MLSAQIFQTDRGEQGIPAWLNVWGEEVIFLGALAETVLEALKNPDYLILEKAISGRKQTKMLVTIYNME